MERGEHEPPPSGYYNRKRPRDEVSLYDEVYVLIEEIEVNPHVPGLEETLANESMRDQIFDIMYQMPRIRELPGGNEVADSLIGLLPFHPWAAAWLEQEADTCGHQVTFKLRLPHYLVDAYKEWAKVRENDYSPYAGMRSAFLDILKQLRDELPQDN